VQLLSNHRSAATLSSVHRHTQHKHFCGHLSLISKHSYWYLHWTAGIKGLLHHIPSSVQLVDQKGHFLLFGFSHLSSLQCFDSAGWVTGRASPAPFIPTRFSFKTSMGRKSRCNHLSWFLVESGQ